MKASVVEVDGIQAVDGISVEKLPGDASDYLNARKQLMKVNDEVQHEIVAKDSNPQPLKTRSELLNSGVNSRDKAGQLDDVQLIMNEQKVENFHNTHGTNAGLDYEHEEDGQRAKEMEVDS
ncbi:hypothetical protein HAX54_044317 [Datura stramonium]|uniref:Uncharacterized protein n=1 Tax=Datura stramonium TaxID=4076 RepID=A0ABS8SPC0_DATST|nr:hypothetical protein [Datura stramonium]